MAKASFDSNSNPIFVGPVTNVIVATVKLALSGTRKHKVLVIGEFSAEGSLANGYIVGDIQIDGNTFLDTQVNNLNGTVGTIVTVTGIVTVSAGKHTFELRAYTNASSLSVHHRALSVVDLN